MSVKTLIKILHFSGSKRSLTFVKSLSYYELSSLRPIMNVWVRVSSYYKCEIKLDKQRCFTGHKIPTTSWPNSHKDGFRFEWNGDDGSQIVSITTASSAAVYHSCISTRDDHHQHHRLEQQTHSTGYRFIASKITLIPDTSINPSRFIYSFVTYKI